MSGGSNENYLRIHIAALRTEKRETQGRREAQDKVMCKRGNERDLGYTEALTQNGEERQGSRDDSDKVT